jgi:hypothetical protein
MGTGAAGPAPGAGPRPHASGRSGPDGRTASTAGPARRRDRRPARWGRERQRSSLLARSRLRSVVTGAGPGGACRTRRAQGKSDAPRGRDSAGGRRAADRDGRGGPRGSADGVGPRPADCGRGLPAGTGDYSTRGRDRRRDTGRRAAGTGGRPASGGSPRPRGPGAVRWAVDKRAGVCDKKGKPPTPPRGGCARGSGGISSRPSSFSLRGGGSLPENHYLFPLLSKLTEHRAETPSVITGFWTSGAVSPEQAPRPAVQLTRPPR